MQVLAIDLGKTGCRVLRRNSDGQQIHGQGGGALGMSHPEGPRSAMRAIDRALVAGEVSAAGLDTVCLGAAGVAAAPDAAAEMAALLAERFGARALVTSDSVTSHAGALDGGDGVVLAVGTGAVAVTFDAAGTLVQVDGWGQSLGDEGSGWWIGREGLMAACRGLDGRGPATALLDAAQQEFGDLRALPARLGDATAAIPVLAAFAPQVLAAAEAADQVAIRIVSAAQQALAATAAAAARRTPGAEQVRGSAPVPGAVTVRCCLIGGLAAWPEHFRSGLQTQAEQQVRAGGEPGAGEAPAADRLAGAGQQPGAGQRAGAALTWVEPAGTSLDGAALIATDAALPHRNSCVSAVPGGA